MIKSQIPTRAPCCFIGQESFKPASEYISYLKLNDSTQERVDICPQCWEKSGGKDFKGVYWKGRIPPKKTKPLALDEEALKLFKSLIEIGNEKKLLTFLILYLMRNGHLVQRPHHIYEIPMTGEAYKFFLEVITPEEGKELAEELKRRLAADSHE